MPPRQSVPHADPPRLWLVTDQRNDAKLEAALRRMPRGSGLIFRHWHLPPVDRKARFQELARVARRHGHRVHLSGSARLARRWRADGSYGPARLGRDRTGLVTAHNLREIAAARRVAAMAIVISPVYPTRSHPGGRSLGRCRFLLRAAFADRPVIALGGMNAARARGLPVYGWAAIDGLTGDRGRTA